LRVQRFRLKMMSYSYTIVYTPGKRLVLANALSHSLTEVEMLECVNSSGLISKCFHHLPRKILIQIYNSFVNSKSTYCLESWGNTANIYLEPLHLLQKKILRIIYEKNIPHLNNCFFVPQSCLFTIYTHSNYYCSHINFTTLD